MCLLCVEIQKQLMSPREIARACRESVSEEHLELVLVEAQKQGIIEEVLEELKALDDLK